MLPKSPWEESLADKLNEGVPTDDKVDEIFAAIRPLLPTPHKITFDWHFAISITALLNELLIVFFKCCNAYISRSITFFAVDINFLLINVTRYHP